MAWWDGDSCVSSDCIEAIFYNAILDKGEDAWDCVYGVTTGGPFVSIPRATTSTEICAADVNVVRGHIDTMTTECGDCDWVSLGDPCEDSVDVSSGEDVCVCDYYCLDVALDCILDNCCGAKKCVAEFRVVYNCDEGQFEGDVELFGYFCVDEAESTGVWTLRSRVSDTECNLRYYADCLRACETDPDCEKKCVEVWEASWNDPVLGAPVCILNTCNYTADETNLNETWYFYGINGSDCILRWKRAGVECVNDGDCGACGATPPDAADPAGLCGP